MASRGGGADNRELKFTPSEMERLREHVQALNTSYADFIRWAVIHALDECDAIVRSEQEGGAPRPRHWRVVR